MIGFTEWLVIWTVGLVIVPLLTIGVAALGFRLAKESKQ